MSKIICPRLCDQQPTLTATPMVEGCLAVFSICNPIAQAALLNEQKTQFNIAIGLCVGHDSLFYKYSDAPVTTLIAKDRVLAHNPCGAIYCAQGYFREKLKE